MVSDLGKGQACELWDQGKPIHCRRIAKNNISNFGESLCSSRYHPSVYPSQSYSKNHHYTGNISRFQHRKDVDFLNRGSSPPNSSLSLFRKIPARPASIPRSQNIPCMPIQHQLSLSWISPPSSKNSLFPFVTSSNRASSHYHLNFLADAPASSDRPVIHPPLPMTYPVFVHLPHRQDLQPSTGTGAPTPIGHATAPSFKGRGCIKALCSSLLEANKHGLLLSE